MKGGPDNDNEPWKPFNTRADFEFAQLTLEASLSWGQVKHFIQLINHLKSGKEGFSLSNHADLSGHWQQAASGYNKVGYYPY